MPFTQPLSRVSSANTFKRSSFSGTKIIIEKLKISYNFSSHTDEQTNKQTDGRKYIDTHVRI